MSMFRCVLILSYSEFLNNHSLKDECGVEVGRGRWDILTDNPAKTVGEE